MSIESNKAIVRRYFEEWWIRASSIFLAVRIASYIGQRLRNRSQDWKLSDERWKGFFEYIVTSRQPSTEDDRVAC